MMVDLLLEVALTDVTQPRPHPAHRKPPRPVIPACAGMTEFLATAA